MFINSSIANLHEQSYHILLRKKGIYLSHFIIVDIHHRYFTSTQKLKSYLVRTQSLNVLPLNLGVGQYIAIHAALTARDFFPAYFYPSGPVICIFPNLFFLLPVLAVANTGSCVGPQNEIGHPAGCRFPC